MQVVGPVEHSGPDYVMFQAAHGLDQPQDSRLLLRILTDTPPKCEETPSPDGIQQIVRTTQEIRKKI